MADIKGLNKDSNIKIGGALPDPPKQYRVFDKSKFSFTGSTGDVDLRPYSSPRHNQGSIGCCTAAATVKALEIKRIIEHGIEEHQDLSILDVYWGSRDLMSPKMTDVDSGTYLSLACDVLRRYGVCREKMHPFISRNLYIPPPILATREARLNRIHSHFRLVSSGNELLDDIVLNLRASNPVVFATQVGSDWKGYKGGEPIGIETEPSGGHAITIVGIVNGLFIIENSWGKNWGLDGFAFVKPEVFTHRYSRDFWVIVTGSEAWFEK